MIVLPETSTQIQIIKTDIVFLYRIIKAYDFLYYFAKETNKNFEFFSTQRWKCIPRFFSQKDEMASLKLKWCI